MEIHNYSIQYFYQAFILTFPFIPAELDNPGLLWAHCDAPFVTPDIVTLHIALHITLHMQIYTNIHTPYSYLAILN